MIVQVFIFALALMALVHGATVSTKYAERLAKSFRLSAYTVGFIVIAIISILPETFVSVSAVFQGIPSFGFGTLLGSNIADLTLVFAVLTLLIGRGIKVEKKILKEDALYPFLLIMPLVLGFDGKFSRIEGLALIAAGVAFYYLSLKSGTRHAEEQKPDTTERLKNAGMLLVGMTLLTVGAHFIVSSATYFAVFFEVKPVLIGMLIVGLGTVIPEFLFAYKSVKSNNDSLAIGDILGTVLADATVVIGIIAVLQPFTFSKTIIYVAGVFMVAGCFMLFSFMRSGRMITRREGFALFLFWLTFILVEFIVNG